MAALACVPSARATITLQGIAAGNYYAQSMRQFRSAPDGESYMQISEDGKKLLSYSFKNGTQNGVVVDLTTARGDKVESIDGYILSPDGRRILIQTNTSPIYRHSFTAQYYIYDVNNKTLTALSAGGAQMQPQFSPDGTMISFVRGGNLYLVKLLFDNAESQVTKDGETGKVLNGVPDWVNEEEFSTACSYVFTADSKMLVWVRYDESAVKTFAFPMYKGAAPEYSAYEGYPGQYSYKYPIAGEANSKVEVHSYDIKSHVERTVNVPVEAEGYIPRIFQTSDPEKIAVVTLNRHQDQMDIYAANPRSTVCKLLVREKAEKYLRESAFSDLRFYGDHFAMVSDRNGYNNIYWYDINGHLAGQVTKGDYEVQDFYGYDARTGNFYYSANADGPQYTTVMCANLKGAVKKLSTQKGDNSASFSANFQYFVNTYSSIATAPVTTLCNAQGKVLKTLVDNSALKAKIESDAPATVEMFEFTTSGGTKLNGYMVKPANFDASKKYPVIMYQYSGPGSQQVRDSWSSGFMGGLVWERYLAQEGFISVCVDGRGTGGRGAEFEKQTYLRLGLFEAQDQVETALYLGKLSYVDKDRIGIWGWSYGGFNTLMSMSEGRAVFKAGVAIAPVTSYRFYDTVYTERYMRTPNENSAGYDDCPISRAANLSGDLLLIHGSADDNVHFRNTAEYSEALVQAGKQFQMQVYTNRNHSIYGGNTRLHLYTRVAEFFKDKLKK
jgi:dipeptidyl-peptidase 4